MLARAHAWCVCGVCGVCARDGCAGTGVADGNPPTQPAHGVCEGAVARPTRCTGTEVLVRGQCLHAQESAGVGDTLYKNSRDYD